MSLMSKALRVIAQRLGPAHAALRRDLTQLARTQAQLGKALQAPRRRSATAQPQSTSQPSPATMVLVKSLGPAAGPMGARLREWFGPEGGRQVPFNPARAASLRMSGQLADAQLQRWRRFGRVPDHVATA